MQEYETTYVIDSLLKSEEIEGIINKYERFISANGGEIKNVERWGKKRLAYEIKKRQYGYYVYIRYIGPSTIIKPLEREFRLNESILRYLTVKFTSKMLKHEQLKETKRLQDKPQTPIVEEVKKPLPDTEPVSDIDFAKTEDEVAAATDEVSADNIQSEEGQVEVEAKTESTDEKAEEFLSDVSSDEPVLSEVEEKKDVTDSVE